MQVCIRVPPYVRYNPVCSGLVPAVAVSAGVAALLGHGGEGGGLQAGVPRRAAALPLPRHPRGRQHGQRRPVLPMPRSH